MKLTALLIAIAPLTLALHVPILPTLSANPLSPRGLLDDMRMKEKCDSIFKSDKTKYKVACSGEADEDSMNLCMLRALLGDASPECRAGLAKMMNLEDDD
jgi:hypothetical protein